MKLDMLCWLIDRYNPASALVFCNTKRGVDKIVKALQARGYQADGLHGDMKQPRRDRTMLQFRQGLTRILVATDLAARGLDVDGIETVINYDLPQDEQYYVHRIGRTARMGKSGHAVSLALSWEWDKLKAIEAYAETKIVRQTTPALQKEDRAKRNNLFVKDGNPSQHSAKHRSQKGKRKSPKRM
jgi:ATP-dependent RNA helicase DeaD